MADTVLLLAAAGLLLLLLLAAATVRRRRGDQPVAELGSRAVLVTGCDTGFGHELALRLLQMEMDVYAGCLTQAGIAQLRSKAAGGRLRTFLLDVTSDESVRAMAGYLAGELKERGLWCAVHNAGTCGALVPDDWMRADAGDYDAALGVNLMGTIRANRATIALVRRARGRVVVMSSMMGMAPGMYLGAYSVSKMAVAGYAAVLSREQRPFGVSVHLVEPGIHQTSMIEHSANTGRIRRQWDLLPQTTRQLYGERFVHALLARHELMERYAARCGRAGRVVDAYAHAVTARRPRRRYTLGMDANIVRAAAMLPDRLADAALLFLNYFCVPAAPAQCCTDGLAGLGACATRLRALIDKLAAGGGAAERQSDERLVVAVEE